jgi:succinate-semialdehyde dehydrogenase/glutarate-semialdehyde dehydrogenase
VLLKHAHTVWGSALALEQLYHDSSVPNDLFRVLKISSEQSNELIAVEVCTTARIYNNGETCVAAKRFIVVDTVYDEFVDAFVEQLQTIEMDDPNDEATGLGPMARKDLRDDLRDQVRTSGRGRSEADRGGEIPDRPGFFYPVTVLEDVEPGMPAYDDELFGPVASILRVADDDEAMRVANDSRFGLGGGIISEDVDRAIAMAIEEFDTGMININGYHLANPHLPFGGVKDSGYGREHGGSGLKEFVNVKSIQVTES